MAYFNNKKINDFVLNIKGDNIIDDNKIFSNIVFTIFYEKFLVKFYFKNINQFTRENINFNLIVFHIQKNEIHIQNNMIIQFGCSINYYIYIQLKGNLIEIILMRKFLEKIDETILIYNQKESPITIGEKGKLKIPGKKKLSLLLYDKVFNYWIIREQNDEIWVYSNDTIELNKTLLFKIGKEIFQTSIENSNI